MQNRRLIHRVVGAVSTSCCSVKSRFLKKSHTGKEIFLWLSFFVFIAPLWSISESNGEGCKGRLSSESSETSAPAAPKKIVADSNAKSRAQYVAEYNAHPNRLTLAEEIAELNTVRVRLKGERFPDPKDGLPPVYVVFYHGAGTGKAGPHSSEQNLIDLCSPHPGKKGSTQAKVQALPNYVLMGGEAIALPSSKAGPSRSDFRTIEQNTEFIVAHWKFLRSELPPGTKLLVDPRSSSPHLLAHAIVRNPGLIDGFYGMSANVGGTKPADIARIAEGTAALISDLKKQNRENDLDEGGLAWIDSLLAQFDWIPQEIIDSFPESLFVTGMLDEQTLRSDRVTQIEIAKASGGKIQFVDYADGTHNVLETSEGALPDFFNLVARVRGDKRAHQQLEHDMAAIRDNKYKGVGVRGFFGSSPKPTDDNLIATIPTGVMHWSMAMRSVKKGEAGIEEARKVLEIPGVKENLIHRPVFISSSSSQLAQISATLRKLSFEAMKMNERAANDPAFKKDPSYRAPEFYSGEVKKIVSSDKVAAAMTKILAESDLQIFELDASGNPVYFTPEQIKAFFDPNHMKIAWEKNGALGVIKAIGWSYPKMRGVLSVEKAKQRSAYTAGKKSWDKLEKANYTIKRNQDFWGVLEGLKNQDRVGKTVEENRYSDPEYLKQVQLAYQKGLVDTIEFYDENGKLVGGSLAFKIGKTYSFDSVFYPVRETYRSTHRVDGIDFQKMILAKTIDIMEQEGIPVADIQMVSHLTAQFAGEYVPVEEFERMVWGNNVP